VKLVRLPLDLAQERHGDDRSVQYCRRERLAAYAKLGVAPLLLPLLPQSRRVQVGLIFFAAATQLVADDGGWYFELVPRRSIRRRLLRRLKQAAEPRHQFVVG
jgi:hypothetical protein